MTAPRRDLAQRIAAVVLFGVFAVALAAVVPVGEATWIEMLTVSGEVSTDWTEPPAPARLVMGEVTSICDPEPSLLVSITNSGEMVGEGAVLEAWIGPGTADAALTGSAAATAVSPGATELFQLTATPGATHVVALLHGSADTVWSDPIEFPADACVSTAAEPVTTTTATTSTSTTSTTEASTTTSSSSSTTSSTSSTTSTTEATTTTSSSSTTSSTSSTTSTTEATTTTSSSSSTTTTEATTTTTTSSSTTTTTTEATTTTTTTTTTLPG